MMRHLVTGGSGFIGSRVARRLWAEGHAVRILDTWIDPDLPAGIERIEGDVCDPAAVEAAMNGVEVVHHNAALVAQANAGSRYWAVNVDGSRNVAAAAVRAGVGLMVHVSSTSIYGLSPAGPITAETVPHPFEPYGRSKWAGEQSMVRICGQAGLPLITIRPRATLGAGRLGIFQILFQWIAENRRVYITGDGSNHMQFVHADDLVDAYMLALARGESATYNVGTDRFGTLRQDLEALTRHAGSGARVIGLPPRPAMAVLNALHRVGLSPLVPWQYRTYHRDCYFDVSPLKALGWRPRYSNVNMLAESYDWFRAQREAGSARSAHRSPLAQQALGLLRRLS
ncbi:MAG TPA: NAD-dependent epimerase/dehydratase family protein [Sphingobium sp.]